MKDGRTLPVIQPSPEGGLSRRSALQTLAAGLGASLAVPGLAEANAEQVHQHAGAVAAQTRKPAAASKAAPYVPTTFDAHQFATVVVLAELIVPGAKASGTPEFLDKLLTVESPETRRRFITALGAMDGAALKAKQAPFKDLAAADQVALLTEASTGQPSRQPVFWKKGDPIPVPETPAGPPPCVTTSITSRDGCRASTSRPNPASRNLATPATCSTRSTSGASTTASTHRGSGLRASWRGCDAPVSPSRAL